MSAASLLGGGDEPSLKVEVHDGGGENHEFQSAAADAYDAAKEGDRKSFAKGLYAAICAVLEEEDDEEGEGE